MIRFAGWSAGETEMKNYQKIIEDFQKANPDIIVKYEVITQMFSENILASYAAGAAPDIFYVDSAWAPTFISKGALYPIGDKLPKDFIDQFYPFLLEPFKGPDGKIYGLPKDWSVLSLFYNKKLFAQAGVPEPTADWTWDDLFNAAKTIYQKTGKPGLVVHAELNRWVPFLVSNGAPPPRFDSAADAAYFDKPEVRNAISKMIAKIQEGRKEGYIVLPSDVNAGWNGEAFGKQLAAMTIEGSWMIPYLADQFPNFKYGSDWDLAMLPKGPAGRASMAYTVALGVNSKTENLDAALKFLQYVEGIEGQKLLVVKMGHTLPSIKALANDPDLWPSHAKELSFVNKYDRVALFFYGPKTGQIEGSINQIIQSAVRGEITIDEALRLMKDKVAEAFKS
ncbi:extracellular solute-binding protein, family 1 [Thermofilum pendens Hrk 5]|uniref:Extracellular solute-binding protein, family 1 n=1 Tax=Thermofilum pendens (strain DSM 2475 / Hrk 5) TaxID=368408 RepID=A1RZC0_THEPD|nr:extracellular solute-binding protein, family 1 [Thermofilum pendens Hrk 5]